MSNSWQVFSTCVKSTYQIVDKIITATITLARYLWHRIGGKVVVANFKRVTPNQKQPENTHYHLVAIAFSATATGKVNTIDNQLLTYQNT